ncbi:AraC family transcriptional regulator [Sphingobacterium multivorum]|uniref:AraC family transcriptional regulator n=1 Tax=Sphingobacterium multivorum TaxID=28454 RepID=UPI0031B9C54D
MNTIYEHFSFPPNQSFTIRMDDYTLEEKQHLHKHANYEIALIENGVGTRFINGSAETFHGTDLVLIAGDVSHCWRYQGTVDEQQQVRIIVVHFFPDFLGKGFLHIPEAKAISKLLQRAKKGIVFHGDVLDKAKLILEKMLTEKEMGRVLLFLKLMDLLSNTSSCRVLNDASQEIVYSDFETKKMDTVLQYILNNFNRQLSLVEMAAITAMAPNSFCRYFKLKTGRRFSDFIKELRINHAAKLLVQGNYSISESGYLSGYNNISNFNKHFKEIKGMSPRLFKKMRVV